MDTRMRTLKARKQRRAQRVCQGLASGITMSAMATADCIWLLAFPRFKEV